MSILRYGMLDIRLVLARGLSYGLLSGLVLAGYAVLVLALSGVASALVVSLLAFPLRFTGRRIAAVIDARRSEVFWAFYRAVPGGVQRMGEPTVSTPDELAAELLAQGGETLLVGDGAIRYSQQLGDITGVEIAGGDHAYPSARSLVQLAHARALREEWVRPHEVELLYLRKPDAEINWSIREGA